MTNKFLASSQSLFRFFQKLKSPFGSADDFIFVSDGYVIACCGLEFPIESHRKEKFDFELSKGKIVRLERILSALSDQPILIEIDSDRRFWVKEFII
jgi:hypothetical protein